MSTDSAIDWSSELPMPCPESADVRNRTGRPDVVAACSRAVNLREWDGSTRGSLAPVNIRIAG